MKLAHDNLVPEWGMTCDCTPDARPRHEIVQWRGGITLITDSNDSDDILQDAHGFLQDHFSAGRGYSITQWKIAIHDGLLEATPARWFSHQRRANL